MLAFGEPAPRFQLWLSIAAPRHGGCVGPRLPRCHHQRVGQRGAARRHSPLAPPSPPSRPSSTCRWAIPHSALLLDQHAVGTATGPKLLLTAAARRRRRRHGPTAGAGGHLTAGCDATKPLLAPEEPLGPAGAWVGRQRHHGRCRGALQRPDDAQNDGRQCTRHIGNGPLGRQAARPLKIQQKAKVKSPLKLSASFRSPDHKQSLLC